MGNEARVPLLPGQWVVGGVGVLGDRRGRLRDEEVEWAGGDSCSGRGFIRILCR